MPLSCLGQGARLWASAGRGGTRAPVHPVAVVDVHDVVDAPDDRLVDVAADDAVHAQALGLVRQRLLIAADHLDRELALRPARQSCRACAAAGRPACRAPRARPPSPAACTPCRPLAPVGTSQKQTRAGVRGRTLPLTCAARDQYGSRRKRRVAFIKMLRLTNCTRAVRHGKAQRRAAQQARLFYATPRRGGGTGGEGRSPGHRPSHRARASARCSGAPRCHTCESADQAEQQRPRPRFLLPESAGSAGSSAGAARGGAPVAVEDQKAAAVRARVHGLLDDLQAGRASSVGRRRAPARGRGAQQRQSHGRGSAGRRTSTFPKATASSVRYARAASSWLPGTCKNSLFAPATASKRAHVETSSVK